MSPWNSPSELRHMLCPYGPMDHNGHMCPKKMVHPWSLFHWAKQTENTCLFSSCWIVMNHCHAIPKFQRYSQLAEWTLWPLLDPEIARARASVASGKTVGFLRVRLDFPEPCVKWIPCWAELHWLRRDKLQGNDWDDVTGATCWEPSRCRWKLTLNLPQDKTESYWWHHKKGRDWLVNWNRVLLISCVFVCNCKKGGKFCWHGASARANTKLASRCF